VVSFREQGEKQIPSIISQAPEEEWYSISLETIQSIPRKIQAVLQANGCPTPY